MSTPEIYRYDGENPPVKVGGVSALLPALVPISYQDFMNLPQEEQESGSYIVTNMPTLMNAYSLGYKDGLSAGQKLDQISSDLTELLKWKFISCPKTTVTQSAVYATLSSNLPSDYNDYCILYEWTNRNITSEQKMKGYVSNLLDGVGNAYQLTGYGMIISDNGVDKIQTSYNNKGSSVASFSLYVLGVFYR